VTLSSESWQLTAPDWLGDLARLRAQARAELAAAGRTGVPDRLAGNDSTSSVSVEVDVRGRVRGIEVSRLWRGRLQPGRVGAALFEAYQAAITVAYEARVIRSVLDDDEPTGPAPDSGASVPADARRRDDAEVDPAAGLEEYQRLFADLSAQLAAYRRGEGVAPDTETTVSSPDRLFTMRRRGSAVTGITGDASRIEEADMEQLRGEAFDLFRVAGLTTVSERMAQDEGVGDG
jgi:hypothetical protein